MPVDPDPDPEALADTDDVDEEAAVDELPPERPLASSPGLGADLPEADVLDQWREEELDEDEDEG